MHKRFGDDNRSLCFKGILLPNFLRNLEISETLETLETLETSETLESLGRA